MGVAIYLGLVKKMLSLSDREWEEYFIEDVCIIHSGVRLTKADMIPGDTPFIGSSDSNNGVTAFTGSTNSSLKKNVLGVNYNGSVVENFYHPYEALFSDDVKQLEILHDNPTEYMYLFLKVVILKQKSKYAYGYKFNAERMRRQIILLPSNAEGNPDWEFMGAYIKERKDQLVQKQIAFLEGEILRIGGGYIDFKEEKAEWQPFSIGELFHTFTNGKGKGLNHLNKVQYGGIEYIGATNRNDGVLCFVEVNSESAKMIQPGNCIGFIRNGDGSAGYAIYREGEFISTSDVMYGYADWLNESTGRFFVVAQDKIKAKYGHGHKRSAERLKGDRVMLPIDSDGNPDWLYMERYEKGLRLKKLIASRRFLDAQLRIAN